MIPCAACTTRNVSAQRDGAVLVLRLHTAEGPLKWGAAVGSVHAQLGRVFEQVAREPDVRAVLLTGTGASFCAEMAMEELPDPAEAALWQRITQEGTDLIERFLDIPVPVVAAINGPALIHAELPMLADIVLGADTMTLADQAHFVHGIVPGDGAHVVWPALLGPNRGRAFLLTGEAIDAQEALRLGLVAEVLAQRDLWVRALAVTQHLASRPSAVARGTRALFTAPWKRRMAHDLAEGFAREGAGFAAA